VFKSADTPLGRFNGPDARSRPRQERHWIATQVSGIPLATFLSDIDRRQPMPSEHIFVRYPQGTVGYVMAPAEDQLPVPNAFHYHFHSERAGDILQFHQRYFT
jgi:hypothetical protein